MLGQALAVEAARRKQRLTGVARRGTPFAVDISDPAALGACLAKFRPALVINAAAITSLDACERDPARAYAVNARAVATMSEWCRDASARLVHISTDHFFSGDGDRPHGELAPVCLVNEYARTKYVGECFAALASRALIVRTNVTGLRGWDGQATFFEWAMTALRQRAPLALFEDFYTSTIDAPSLAVALFDLVARDATGLLNVASSSVASKRRFVHALAEEAGVMLDWGKTASVASLPTARAESLGLEVANAERLLGRRLPDLSQVAKNLISQWKEQCATQAA
jgi:dTDP-4-dehydrorhamnose reductase